MGIFRKKDKYPTLRSEKEYRKSKVKSHFIMWAFILIPVLIIWVAFFNSDWLQNFLGSSYPVARAKITFSLLAICIALWLLCKLFVVLARRVFNKDSSSSEE